jgi:hypothetical protein
MATILKVIYRVNAIPIKIQGPPNEKKELGLQSHIAYKINPKWIIDLNTRAA